MTYLGKQIQVENTATLFSFMTFLRGYKTIRNCNPISVYQSYVTCRETGYGVLGLPKLCDMQGDGVRGAGSTKVMWHAGRLGMGVLGLPKLCDMQGDWVQGCWVYQSYVTCRETGYQGAGLKGSLPPHAQTLCMFPNPYRAHACARMHVWPALQNLINSWLYLKITIIARTLYGGEKLQLSAKYDKNEADKLYSQWPSKSGLRAKCLFIILGRITKLTLFQNLTHAK